MSWSSYVAKFGSDMRTGNTVQPRLVPVEIADIERSARVVFKSCLDGCVWDGCLCKVESLEYQLCDVISDQE